MQTSGVLLEDTAPLNGHGQHQGIQCRMVKTFAYECPGGQEDPRCIFGQRLQFTDQQRPLFLGYAAVERIKIGDVLTERDVYHLDVLGALSQY